MAKPKSILAALVALVSLPSVAEPHSMATEGYVDYAITNSAGVGYGSATFSNAVQTFVSGSVEIPKNLGAFTNDVGYITKEDVPEIPDPTKLFSADGKSWQDATGCLWQVVSNGHFSHLEHCKGNATTAYYPSGIYGNYTDVGYGERFTTSSDPNAWIITNVTKVGFFRQTSAYGGDIYVGTYTPGDEACTLEDGSTVRFVYVGYSVTNLVGRYATQSFVSNAVANAGGGSAAGSEELQAEIDRATKAEEELRQNKQDKLVIGENFDDSVLSDSTNPVTARGVASFVNSVFMTIPYIPASSTYSGYAENAENAKNAEFATNAAEAMNAGHASSASIAMRADGLKNNTEERTASKIFDDIDTSLTYATRIYTYMTANTNAWFEGENYLSSSGKPCTLKLQEIRDGVEQTVWDQRDLANKNLETVSGWIAATNAALLAQIDGVRADMPKSAWSWYDSFSGQKMPTNDTTFISSPEVVFSGGYTWEKNVTSGGECWILVNNGMSTVYGSNGADSERSFFAIKDYEGNSIFEVQKTASRMADAVPSSCRFDESVGDYGEFTVEFSSISDIAPTAYVSATLDLATRDFQIESSATCCATVTWTGSSGAWVCHIRPKTKMSQIFAFAKFEIAGSVQIVSKALMSIESGIACTNTATGAMGVIRPSYNGSTVTWTWSEK